MDLNELLHTMTRILFENIIFIWSTTSTALQECDSILFENISLLILEHSTSERGVPFLLRSLFFFYSASKSRKVGVVHQHQEETFLVVFLLLTSNKSWGFC